MKVFFVGIFLLILLVSAQAYASTYSGNITKIQAEGIGDAYNTLYLDFNITDSPCSSTNAVNRLTIVNNAQQSAALAALMAGKKVDVQSNGVCQGNIEGINYIIIKAGE